MGYRLLTPLNVLRTDSREPLLSQRWTYLANNFLRRIWTCDNHPLKTTLEKIIEGRETPTFVQYSQLPLLASAFKDMRIKLYLLEHGHSFLGYSREWESYWLKPAIDMEKGRSIKNSLKATCKFDEIFRQEITQT